jgi:hypothetical protein
VHSTDARADEIGRRVRAFIDDPGADGFDRLARDVFAYQIARNPPYARYCERRGVGADVASWRDIPPLPVHAFKEVSLACGSPALIFRTSGTTDGMNARGTHEVVDPTIYAHALCRGFREFVLPDRERIRVLSLVASPRARADSSLSHMSGVILDAFGDSESETYVGEEDILLGAFFAALDRASSQDVPVLVFTTTLALVPVLEAAKSSGHTFRLPRGSRIMDTGGTKGHGREFNERALLDDYEAVFGVPAAACINEYGMTELLSQYYNDDLRRHLRGESITSVDRARKRAPHWLRARVLDPDTMQDAERGLLAHVDLTN